MPSSEKLHLNNKRFDSKTELKRIIIQFTKFALVGVSNTLVSWMCYYFFLWIDENLYLVGSIVGTIVSIANAFFWNDKFVFKGGGDDWRSKIKRLGKTYISYGATSILGTVILWLEVTALSINKAIAPLINLCITLPINFLINKFWTFRAEDLK